MKTARQLSIAVLVLMSIISLYLGIRMILDPTGSALGLPYYLLNGSMFADYTKPGWILVLVPGALSVATILVIVRRVKWYSICVIAQGVLIVGCAVAQMILLGDENFLQYFFLMMGMGLIALGALQYQMRYGEENQPGQAAPKKEGHKHRH
ncbi:MAG: hypothetical protein NVSMB63_11040 [Sediminibacterium sp.]